ncbi:hypothetical protein QQ045_030813 [Rhodiola kirilowii]
MYKVQPDLAYKPTDNKANELLKAQKIWLGLARPSPLIFELLDELARSVASGLPSAVHGREIHSNTNTIIKESHHPHRPGPDRRISVQINRHVKHDRLPSPGSVHHLLEPALGVVILLEQHIIRDLKGAIGWNLKAEVRVGFGDGFGVVTEGVSGVGEVEGGGPGGVGEGDAEGGDGGGVGFGGEVEGEDAEGRGGGGEEVRKDDEFEGEGEEGEEGGEGEKGGDEDAAAAVVVVVVVGLREVVRLW